MAPNVRILVSRNKREGRWNHSSCGRHFRAKASYEAFARDLDAWFKQLNADMAEIATTHTKNKDDQNGHSK